MLKALIYVFYFFNLRRISIIVQRFLAGEYHDPTRKLPTPDETTTLEQPQGAIDYIRHVGPFQYRLDQYKILNWFLPLDWVTDPEVFHARLASADVRDGDCDDYHYFVATLLSDVPDVSDVLLHSIVWDGDSGVNGHTVCSYTYADQRWLVDYTIQALGNRNIDEVIIDSHAKGAKLKFMVTENLNFDLIAVKA
jgi:hypothetical protein